MPIANVSQSPTHLSSLPSSSSSASTLALLSLTQDITALISLSLEGTASWVHDWFRSTLGIVGLGEVVPYNPQRTVDRANVRVQEGRGLAVVVVGASEPTGQSLSLHLAKSGYTVFPFVPLPSPHSPPTSAALSSLLLTWSGMQERLRARYPSHPGGVVPVITDPESSADDTWTSPKSDPKGKGRFAHAGETVRAYCKENGLELVAIVCTARGPRRTSTIKLSSPNHNGKLEIITGPLTPPDRSPASPPTSPQLLSISIPRTLHYSALAMTDEQTLISLYRTNVLDPLSVIRELSDLLSAGPGRGRVVFVNGGKGVEVDEFEDSLLPGAMRMMGAARSEAAKLLRGELGGVGIDVCEVVVGPMSPRIGTPGYHLRRGSDDSNDSDTGRKKLLTYVLQSTTPTNQDQDADLTRLGKQAVSYPPDVLDACKRRLGQVDQADVVQILAQRLAYLSRIWAVDDALLFSAVRRAIEDRYPRYRHHAGLSPLLASLGEITPGSGIVKVLGRWVVGRLLMPRGGTA